MKIDLNADLGEGGPSDRELLQLVTSANISCGAHAGSPEEIETAIRHALRQNVGIGAHPSYPDRRHFGRRSLRMTPEALRATLTGQIRDLRQRVEALGGTLRHVKPHGALYNDAATDPVLATLICEVVESVDEELGIVGLAGSALVRAAETRGLWCQREAFADRRYNDDGTLVPRSHPRALIQCSEEAGRQTLDLVSGSGIRSIGGRSLSLNADTICLHGDHPQALTSARRLRRMLEDSGATIRVSTPE
ncbi:MAG: 5-oxoprolinase subunit PxpA [Pseudomonadota bacterium]